MQRLGETKAFKDRNLQLRNAYIATLCGWTGIPNFIRESTEISIGAKLTYAMLLKYAVKDDDCFLEQETSLRMRGMDQKAGCSITLTIVLY